MQKYLKYIVVALILFLGMSVDVKAATSICPNKIDSSVWKLVNSSSASTDPETLKQEGTTDTNKTDCCEKHVANSVYYYCDYYEIVEGKKPEDDTQNIDTDQDAYGNAACKSHGYDLTNFEFEYHTWENNDISSQTDDTMICCRQDGGAGSFSCNFYKKLEQIDDDDYVSNCEDIPETTALVKKVYNVIRFLIPVIIIGLSIVDFLKVLLNGEEKVYKEAWTKFIKRILIGIVILILPVILSMIINLSGVIDDYDIDKNNIFCIFS